MSGNSGVRTHIFVKDSELVRCPDAWIVSKRHRPLSRAAVTLHDADASFYKGIKSGDPVEIHLGYRDAEPEIWQGAVVWKKRGTNDQHQIGAVRNSDRPLLETKIRQAFMDDAPDAIVRWAANQAGLTVGRIDQPGVTFPRFVASNISVWELVRQCSLTCQRAFSLDMSKWAAWVGADGKLYWGDFDEPEAVGIEIATGAGLILHSPSEDANALNEVEAFLSPGVSHSQPLSLQDDRRGISGTFRLLAVKHHVTPNKARTHLYYGTENETY